MGFRFQKRIKFGKFFTLNLSRKGVSTSVGVTGARVTYGHGQKRTTLGLEGTGLSHTSVKSYGDTETKKLCDKADRFWAVCHTIQRIFDVLFMIWVALVVCAVLYGLLT
jgi:hypothetical protein